MKTRAARGETPARPPLVGWTPGRKRVLLLLVALAVVSVPLALVLARAWPGARNGGAAMADGAASSSGAGASVGAAPGIADERGRFNLLVVTIDTARADHFGAYGRAGAETPTVDRLAQEGVQFTHAFSPVPLTLPSHISLFSGRVPRQHGVHDNGHVLAPGHETLLAQLLHQAGYRTGAFVGSYVLDRQWGLSPGFDTYVDRFDPTELGPDGLAGVQRPGNEVVDAALDWLGGAADQRFFAWVHLYDPHRPYDPPEPYRTRFADRPYDGEIAFADAQIARLRAFLDQRRLLDRTVIVVAGDHGESLGEHGEVTHGFFVYDSVLHVPLIVRAPAASMHGRRVDALVRTVDVLPTIADLLGVKPPPSLAGSTLVPLMTGAKTDPGLVAYAESLTPRLHYGWSELRTVRQGALKFIAAPKPELYDLDHDPGELHNLYDQQRAQATRLAGLLDGLESTYARDAKPAASASANAAADVAARVDPDAVARLSSLGYLASGGAPASSAIGREDGIVRADPKDKIAVAARLFAANEQLARPDPDPGVTSALEAVTRSDPEIVDAWLMLGKAAARARRLDRAIAMYTHARDLRPDYDIVTIDLARAYRETGRDDLAADAYTRYLALDPSHAYIRYQLGGLYLDRGRLDEAQRTLTDLAKRHPSFALAHVALGVVFARRGDAGGAGRQFRDALAIDPRTRLAHLNLGLLAERQGDPRAALEHCEQEQALNPRNGAASACVARLHGAGPPPAAPAQP